MMCVMHHDECLGCWKLAGCVCIRTAFFLSVAAVRSARAFSWLLRFFRRVSGTSIW